MKIMSYPISIIFEHGMNMKIIFEHGMNMSYPPIMSYQIIFEHRMNMSFPPIMSYQCYVQSLANLIQVESIATANMINLPRIYKNPTPQPAD